ncbi:MAG: LPD38 domain-containing protein, partial [Sedimentisphaerales bacterium]|nr:LPD38 domain-containing protein [Sedimentisphaerales bacterium]
AQVIVNGKPKLYQFDKDLFRAISGMNYFQLPYFMDLLMGKGTRMIRMGATGINIGFAERNVIKDAFTYLAQSNESLASTRRAIPLPAPGTMMGAYIWSETQKLLGNEADPVVELWQQMGGELSQTLGLDRNQIRKAVKDVVANSTQRRLLNVAATPLETMRQIIGISEVSPRLSEFYAVLERHGYTRQKLIEMRALGKRPPRHVLVEASNAAADVTTDFKRQGWLGKWLNRVSPYWNAPLEGLDKYVRTWKVNPKRALIFSAAYAATRIAYWVMVKDDDWYKEQPKWLKYGFWTIAKDGKPWLRIPVPHLWGLVIGGGVEAILNTAEEKNPKELAKWLSQMSKDTIPDFRPSMVTQALEVWANYDLFRRQPIVDETLSRRTADKQYTTYNTQTMIALGGILHLSPAKLEHFIDGISGGIYRRITKPVETLTAGETLQPADIPGLGGLALRQDYSESTQEFYDRKDKIEREYNSAKDDGKVTP